MSCRTSRTTPLNPRRFYRGERSITLIECLVYISVLAVLLSVGGVAFHQGLRRSAALRRNAEEIASALHAGERWRADIRSATAAPRLESDGRRQTLHIPTGAGEVAYAFADGAMWRHTGAETNRVPILPRVSASRVQAEERGGANAWRWELELATRADAPRIRPLFTFQTVAPVR